MGATLVGLVLDRWADLPELQYRPLLRMAYRSLDRAKGDVPAATCWVSDADLARTYRNPYPDDDDHSEDARRRRNNLLREARRARRALVAVGACKPSDFLPPGPEPDYVYELTLRREVT
jgi:hypothetical protein